MALNFGHDLVVDAEAADGKRLPQLAYEALRRQIVTLRLAPGQMVREQDVAAALRMSRTPVREALVRLDTEGWIQLAPRHGFIVAPLAADDLQQMYEVVIGLEWVAAELAARHATPERVAELEGLIVRQEAAVAVDDRAAWAELDDRFHNLIVEMTGNERLKAIWATFADQVYRVRMFTIRLRPRPTRSLQEHREVVEALKTRDGDRVRTLLREQRERACADILEVVRALGPGGR